MRLSNVEHGHRLPRKLLLAVIRATSHAEPQDILKLIFYRPELFGRSFSDLVDATLRGPSSWPVGERELFAAFTSRLNACKF